MHITNATNLPPYSNFSSMFPSLLIGIILFTITIWTIVGNILVILAFIIDKQIRQGGMSNYLIINLAISDLLLGIVVLPFSAAYSTFGVWYFGKIFCEIWLVIDVLCSTASIWVKFCSFYFS
jgi:general stress protein CsbA